MYCMIKSIIELFTIGRISWKWVARSASINLPFSFVFYILYEPSAAESDFFTNLMFAIAIDIGLHGATIIAFDLISSFHDVRVEVKELISMFGVGISLLTMIFDEEFHNTGILHHCSTIFNRLSWVFLFFAIVVVCNYFYCKYFKPDINNDTDEDNSHS